MHRFVRLEHRELPLALRAMIAPDMPPAKRLAMARGLIPLLTKDLLLALYFLAGDKDPDVAREAQISLRDLPETLTFVGVDGESNSKLLHFIACQKYDNHHIHERVARHANTSDATLALLAETTTDDRVIETIVGNERAILRCPSILFGLTRNVRTPQSAIDRLRRFYALQTRREYVVDLPPEQAAVAATRPAPPPPKPRAPVAAEVSAAERLLSVPDEMLHRCVRLTDLASDEFAIDGLFAADLLNDPEKPLDDEERVPILKRIAKLSMVDKLLLGLKGNTEARRVLIRSPNRLIQEAVLGNPRVTVAEVVMVVKERSTPQAVVQKIAGNREWVRHYELRRELCFSPKAPARFIYRSLPVLSPKDLKRLADSRSVPGYTRQMAKSLMARQEKR